MPTQPADPNYIGDLGHGLIGRWSTKADWQAIAHLVATVFRNSADEPLRQNLMDEIRILMRGGFPFMPPEDFALVEDTNRPEHPLVACTCLFRHQWSYGSIPFGVGRPEIVATDPAYRNRGLVRALFSMVHARSAVQGDLVQAITGIPFFYRQFGYEFVLDLGGHRLVDVASIPEKSGEDPDPYALRLATLEDIPDLRALYAQRRGASLVWHEAGESYWRFQISAWDDPEVQGKNVADIGLERRLYMIVDGAGHVQGCLWPAIKRRLNDLRVDAVELMPGVNWQAAMPIVLRLLRQLGAATPGIAPDTPPFSTLRFGLGRTHPVYDVLGEKLASRYTPPYAWYLRVPDLLAFLQHIAPVLEERLANSILAGYGGDLKVDLYGGGLHLHFAQGKCVAIEPWRAPAYGEEAHAGCPTLTLLQLLFGYRSLAELRAIFPDVWANDEPALLIDTLFPKVTSTVHPLG